MSSTSGVLVMPVSLSTNLPPAINDADVVRLLDLAKPPGQRRAIQIVQTAVEHFALRPESLLAAIVARPERADENIAVNLVEIRPGWSATRAARLRFRRFSGLLHA